VSGVDGHKVRWAAGVGVKNSEFTSHWDADAGVTYIPWEKLPPDLDSISEGGIVDKDSLPADFKRNMCSCFLQSYC